MYILRILGLILIAVFALGGVMWLVVPLIIGYLVWFDNGFEIVVLAFLIDAYYGMFAALPWWTILVFLMWSLSLFVKERTLLYTRQQ